MEHTEIDCTSLPSKIYKSDLAKCYEVVPSTLWRWLKKAEIDTGNEKIITKKKLMEIVDHLGEPDWTILSSD